MFAKKKTKYSPETWSIKNLSSYGIFISHGCKRSTNYKQIQFTQKRSKQTIYINKKNVLRIYFRFEFKQNNMENLAHTHTRSRCIYTFVIEQTVRYCVMYEDHQCEHGFFMLLHRTLHTVYAVLR